MKKWFFRFMYQGEQIDRCVEAETEREATEIMQQEFPGIAFADNVNHPSHYTQGGIECIDALEAAVINLKGGEAVCTANAIKYLWRWREKNGVEDLKKAKWYIDRLIKKQEDEAVATSSD